MCAVADSGGIVSLPGNISGSGATVIDLTWIESEVLLQFCQEKLSNCNC